MGQRKDYGYGVVIEDTSKTSSVPSILYALGMFALALAVGTVGVALAVAVMQLSFALSVAIGALGVGGGLGLAGSGIAEIVEAKGRARAMVIEAQGRAQAALERERMKALAGGSLSPRWGEEGEDAHLTYRIIE